uniref:tRNA specific adenosine deaminase 2 n=1 Tax=Echinococcus granulosus TaxID=6210 RepID=A0A068WCZ3_ECHGR|nr:tRNA specific adenosine deaminase 2 [Echinococcus granulosus]
MVHLFENLGFKKKSQIGLNHRTLSSLRMDRAFELAEEALNDGEVPVGCAFVYDGQVIACGRNETNVCGDATQHAEIVAIKRLEQWCAKNDLSLESVLPKAVLYVTVEPCIMCTAALRFGLPVQPKWNDRFGGCGSVMNVSTDDSLRSPLSCKFNGQSDRSINLLKRFFEQENWNAPEEKRCKKTSRDHF